MNSVLFIIDLNDKGEGDDLNSEGVNRQRKRRGICPENSENADGKPDAVRVKQNNHLVADTFPSRQWGLNPTIRLPLRRKNERGREQAFVSLKHWITKQQLPKAVGILVLSGLFLRQLVGSIFDSVARNMAVRMLSLDVHQMTHFSI